MAMAIPYRTVPGTEPPVSQDISHGARGMTRWLTYSERSDDWVENMTRLQQKMDTAPVSCCRNLMIDNGS